MIKSKFAQHYLSCFPYQQGCLVDSCLSVLSFDNCHCSVPEDTHVANIQILMGNFIYIQMGEWPISRFDDRRVSIVELRM